MNFEMAKHVVTSKVSRQVLIGRKHSPKILFGAGVIGVVATTVLACRATLQLDQVLDEHEAQMEKSTNKRQDAQCLTNTAFKVGKLYAPSIVVGCASIAALTGSHVIMTRRNASLMAAYSALDKGYNEYRRRVAAEVGEEREYELRHGVETKEIDVHDTKAGKVHKVKERTVSGLSPYAAFFDEGNWNWRSTPMYNQTFISMQQSYANDKLKAQGHLFLNEVYDMLGIERTPMGSQVGWIRGNDAGDNYVDFGVFQGNSWMGNEFVVGNEKSILLDFNVDGTIWDKI